MTAVEIVVGYQVCGNCGGNGCRRCGNDGETPVREMVELDPVCIDCGESDQYELTVGRCRSCDYEDELRHGYIPSRLGLRAGSE